MSLAFYKILHILGITLLFSGLGGLCVLSISGSDSQPAKKLAGMLHGIALVLILVTGFGALAKLGMGADIPLWVWPKLVIWIVFGGIIVVIRRVPQSASALLVLLPILGAVSAYLVIYHVGSG